MNITNTVSSIKRVKDKIVSILNKLRFSLHGIQYGSGLCVHGHPGLYVGEKAIVKIGDRFYSSNGNHKNPLGRNMQGCIHVNNGASLLIGNHVGVSSVTIWVHENVTIGSYVNIGANTIIVDSDCHSLYSCKRRNLKEDLQSKKNAAIIIGDDVMIGMNCTILKGVTIGDRAVIGAGSVVTRSIPGGSIAAGNPAKVIKTFVNK